MTVALSSAGGGDDDRVDEVAAAGSGSGFLGVGSAMTVSECGMWYSTREESRYRGTCTVPKRQQSVLCPTSKRRGAAGTGRTRSFAREKFGARSRYGTA